MTTLKKQAFKMLQDVPEDKMVYVIEILKWMNGIFTDKNMGFKNIPISASYGSSMAFEAWEKFKKYKGIIHYDIDEKTELAKARDEKYAYFN